MKVMVLTSPQKIVMQEIAKPSLKGEHDVLIKVCMAGICGSEVNGFKGKSARHKPPLIMGHEFVGVVEDAGASVNDLEIGDRVVINPLISCQKCEACLSGRQNVCPNRILIGVDLPGGYSEYVVVPRSTVYSIPQTMSFTKAAMVEPLANIVHMMDKNMVGIVGSLAIIGAGTQGLLALQLAKNLGISPVIVVDIDLYRLGIAEKLGADFIVNSKEEDPIKRIKDLTCGKGVDWAIDAVGTSLTRNQCLSFVPRGGKVNFFGMHEGISELNCWLIVAGELTVRGSVMYTPLDFKRSIEILQRGLVKTSTWTDVVSLWDAQEYFLSLANNPGKLLKVILQV